MSCPGRVAHDVRKLSWSRRSVGCVWRLRALPWGARRQGDQADDELRDGLFAWGADSLAVSGQLVQQSGTYTVSARCVDDAGNTGDPVSSSRRAGPWCSWPGRWGRGDRFPGPGPAIVAGSVLHVSALAGGFVALRRRQAVPAAHGSSETAVGRSATPRG